MVRSAWIALLVLAQCAHARPHEEAPKWEAAERPNAAYALSQLRGIDARLAARAGQPFADAPRSNLHRLEDPFLFADRRERLARLKTMLPPALSVADHTGEPALTGQLVEEEIARTEDESDDIARSSVDMLGLVLGTKDDGWLSFRVDEIREALVKHGVSTFERDELLSIALAAPAPAEGTRAQESLRRLRDMLQHARATALPLLERSVFRQRLEFQTRAHMSPDSVPAAIEHGRVELRAQIDAAFSVIGPWRSAAIRSWAANILAEPARCTPRVPVRTAADLAPPPERARACGLASALADAWNDELEIAAMLAMYEALGTACRAMVLHDQRGDVPSAEKACPRMLDLGDEDARQMRIAANHPVSAVVTGLALDLLVRGGPAHAPARARRWMRFGDAPLHTLELVLNADI
jgi:hypothetical protein